MLLKREHLLLIDLGLFEFHVLSSLLHKILVMLDYFASASLQHGHYFVYVLIVFLLGNATDTAAKTLLYMEIQTWADLAAKDRIGSDPMLAGTERIDVMEELHQIAGMDHTAVRPKIAGTIPDHATGKEDSWKIFSTDADPRICLRILEENVIARLELLDKIVLKKQCIRFRFNHGIFGISNLRDHHRSLAGKSLSGHEILSDPLVQVLGLAHINHIPLSVIISVDAGGMWK